MSQRHPYQGALLIEALITFTLFLMASLALYGLLAQARRAESKASQILLANSLARGLMEQVRAKGYDNLKLGSTQHELFTDLKRDGLPMAGRVKAIVTVSPGPRLGVLSLVVETNLGLAHVKLESYLVR